MKAYILSDETICHIKEIFQEEMTRGLDNSSRDLPMKITFVTNRFKGSESGNFISICAHSHNFTITLVKLKNGDAPEIHKRHYVIDPNVFKKPYIKIYDAFAKCVKEFFIEYHLDGETVPASFCTNLNMEQYSLDTAIIPYFTADSMMYHSKRDIKASFERVLRKDKYQDETNLIKTFKSDEFGTITGTSDIDRIYHCLCDAKLMGVINVQGLEITLDSCHNFLARFQKVALEAGEPAQKIVLDVSHAGVKALDKIFRISLHQHPIHKISHIVQDFRDAHVFGYLFGDFVSGHQFFGYKTDTNSTELVSLLRDIFAIELIRKKKEKLVMQASQVFITLKNFLTLATELKIREKEVPDLLKQRVSLVENINWWLEGCVEDVTMKLEEQKESVFHVRLQELYAVARQLKQIELDREEAARLEQAKLSGKRLRRKKKVDTAAAEDIEEKAAPLDPLILKVSEILKENADNLERVIEIQQQQLSVIKENLETMNNVFDFNVKHENLNDRRVFCFSIFNIWNQENKSLRESIDKLIFLEENERGKLHHKTSSVYLGKRQYLKSIRKLLKVTIFEDTDFVLPKRVGKSKSELLNKFLTCEDYFLNSLKMRREEVEDLNYFISGLHFRQTINNPEDSKAVDYCRRLFVKGVKMRLKEIQDIEGKLKELKDMKLKISLMIPDTMQYVYSQLQFILNKRKSSTEVFENMLFGFDVDLELSDENIKKCNDILTEIKTLIENDIADIKRNIAEFQAKEHSVKSITDFCLQLYNKTMKMRKKEFDVAVSDLDLFETIVFDSYTVEEADLIHHCQEEYLTSACMREKEIETLEFHMKTVDKQFKIEDSQVVVTLKDFFNAALEMEKCECEKVLQLSNSSEFCSDIKMLLVEFSFKDLYNVVALHLKREKCDSSFFAKDPQIYTSLREFLTAAFELKQKEIEIPLSVLKTDLANVLIKLLEEVKQSHKKKLLQLEIHEQALKISRSWKEVFLVAMGIREKEMENIITSKRKQIKEEKAVLQSLKDGISENTDNKASQVVKSWKKILSIVIDLKDVEIEQVNQLLKIGQTNTTKDHMQSFTSKSGTENNAGDDDEDEFDVDDSNNFAKEPSPSEEILKAITACKHIYSIAVDKGTTQLEEMEYEIRPIFSVEYDADKADVSEDEVGRAANRFCHAISHLIESIKTDVSSMKANVESLSEIEGNIKSQAASAKATSTHFLTSLLELEEQALKTSEQKLEEINKAFENVLSADSENLRPFTHLFVGVMSEEKLVTVPDITVEEGQEKEEPQEEAEDMTSSRLTKEEIHNLLMDIDSELRTDEDEQEKVERKAVLDVYESCKTHLEYVVELRNQHIESVQLELERLKLPDPKKIKPKEKVHRALDCITTCKKIFTSSIHSRQSEIKNMSADVERMKVTQNKEQIVVEFEPSEIVDSCRDFFLSAVEARRKNISMMKNEMDSVEGKTVSVSDVITREALSLMKSEIYVTCKDLVLESVDLKIKEIDDISSHSEYLNGIELKIGIQLKQLDPEKQKAICTKLEKAKDVVATCKKLCSSAAERAKKEVRDTDEELKLLKGALESSETSLITATCKNLLMTTVEKRESEIADMQSELCELIEKVQDLLIKLGDSNLMAEEKGTEVEENLNTEAADTQKESQLDLHAETEGDSGAETDAVVESDDLPKDTSSDDKIDIEKICKMKINMVTEFLQECKENISAGICKKQEEISSLESDLDKLKVTQQKVEGEDSQVFSICDSIFFSIVAMRREEIKSFETELKVIERLRQDRVENPQPSEKSDENPEESEVVLAVASCKRVLNLAIKNRKSEKDAVDFELMKLVRFQDSRIGNLSKQFLLTTGQKSWEEMGIIKTKLLKIEGISTENEMELLDVSVEVLKSLSETTEEQIHAIVLALQILVKRKMQMEIEESQFISACKQHISSQICERLKEITVMKQEFETLSENQSFEEGFDMKVLNVKFVYEKICMEAVSVRKKEIEVFQFELIKHYDIKVSEEVSACENNLMTFIEDLKSEVKVYDSEAEGIVKAVNVEKEEISTTLRRLQKFYSTTLKKRIKCCKAFEEELRVLQGKGKASEKERKFDIKASLKQEATFDKLKTDASLAINACKEILYSIIEVAESEIRDINVAREELVRQETVEGGTKKKEQTAFSFQDENSSFTEKEIALLQAIEQDILNSKAAKNHQVTEFCEQFFDKSVDVLEELIQSTKQFIQKLSNIEEILTLEGSKIVYYMTNLVESVLQEQRKEKNLMHEDLQTLKDMNAKENDEKTDVILICRKMLMKSSASKREILAAVLLSLESIKLKEEEFRVEISKGYRYCADLFLKMMEMIDLCIKHFANDLENLKQFGLSDDEEESKLSEDEKAIRKCQLFLLAAIDVRKKLSHSISLELKFLKGGAQETRIEDSKVFPSWCERFLTFLDLNAEDAALYDTVETSSFLPQDLEKVERASSYSANSAKSEACVQILEKFKDLLKSYEQKQKKQPMYTVSSWDDLLMRSFLMDQIQKYSLELDGKWPSDVNKDIIKKDKNWEDIFFEADHLLEKQLNLAAKLRDRKQLFMPISSWSEVLCGAIDEWNVIVKERGSLLKNENLLLQWRGKIKSKENLKYSSGCKYDLKVTKLDEYANHWRNKSSESTNELSLLDVPDVDFEAAGPSFSSGTQTEQDSSAVAADDKVNENSSSWNNLFTKSVELMQEGRKAYNFMIKKDTKLQSEVINLFSSWDALFSRAVEQRKIDLQDEMKESSVFKDLAKIVNEEVQGTIKKQSVFSQSQKFSSWVQLIFESSEMHKSKLIKALSVKKREMEKVIQNPKVEAESCEFSLLTVDPETLLNEGKKLFTKALEIRKEEIKQMEKELKSLDSINENRGNHFKEIPQPILIWKLIVSVAMNFKAAKLKFEPKAEKKYNITSKDLIDAALKSKIKEIESYESYWKKFAKKKFFLDLIPGSVSWSEILVTISQLAQNDISKMSVFGMKAEQEEKEHTDPECKADDTLEKNLEAPEDSACWTDLVVEALEQDDNISGNFENFSENQETENLMSWDEIFFFMDQMSNEIIKESIFDKEVDVNYRKLQDIRYMMSSNFFSWDVLIIGVIEEILLAVHDMSDNEESSDKILEVNPLSCLIDAPKTSSGSQQKNANLKDILKKIGVRSFTQILPSEAGATRLEMEDALNETRRKMMAPPGTIFKKEFNENTAWKCIFPIAVEVWRQKMKNYLKFQDPCCDENTSTETVESKVSNPGHAEGDTASNSKSSECSFISLKNLEKEMAFEYISGIEENVKEKYIQFDTEGDHAESSMLKTSVSPIILEDMKKLFKGGDSMDPEYFNVSATWKEMFRAAFERYKNFLFNAIDLQEIKEDCTDICPSELVVKPDAYGEKRLKFQAANVMNKQITLQDVFEVVDSLKKKNLVTYKEIKQKDVLSEHVPTITSEDFEVSDVIDSFKEIFIKAFKFRKSEKNLIGQDIVKLMLVSQSNCEKYRAIPVIRKLIQCYQVGVRSRSEENESINLKLESLNEFKCIFSGYVECPVTESLLKRNAKRIDEMNNLSDNFQKLQDSFLHKLQTLFDTLQTTFDDYLNKQKEKIQLAYMKETKDLEDNLDVEDQVIFINSKEIFTSMINLRNEETEVMKQCLLDWKKMYKFDDTLENTIHHIFSSVLKFFDTEIFERKNANNLLAQEKDYIGVKRCDLKSKISLAFNNCKNFLSTAIENRNHEVASINAGLLSIRNTFTSPSNQTLEVITLFEECCLKFVETRELEIQSLEEYLENIKVIDISEVQSLCIEYFSEAISVRKSELKTLEDRSESFELFNVNIESELSEAIEEALEGIVDMSSGMTFFHALTEKKENEMDKVDLETVGKCLEIFQQRTEGVKAEIKIMEENSELLKYFKGNSALVVISVLDKFEVLLDNALQTIKLDMDNILSEQNFIKAHQSRFFSEVVDSLANCRKHFEDNLTEIERDVYILQLQLSILCEEHVDEFDEDALAPLSSDTSDKDDTATEDKDKINKSSPQSPQYGVDLLNAEEPSVVATSYAILNSGSEFRINFIGIFSNEIKYLEESENNAYQVLTTCTDNILKMEEMRTHEKEKVEEVLLPLNSLNKIDLTYTCMGCLSCLLQHDIDCLAALMPDCDRLKCTVLTMDQKRSVVFDFCNRSLQEAIDTRISELEYMKTEVTCMECMQSSENSKYESSSQALFRKGIEIRDNEIVNMKNVVENLKSEKEILPAVDTCRKHLQTAVKNRKEEMTSLVEQIEILENEAEMLLLVYGPALETTTEFNKLALGNVIPIVQRLNNISRELKSEEEKIVGACQKIYCSMLETLKIEREAIKFDLESIQEVELESKDMIDTEGKELIVSFKDLYVAAFNSKKSVLEKDIRKRNIEENIRKKKAEIINSASKGENVETGKEKECEVNDLTSSESSNEQFQNVKQQKSQETFETFVEFYDIKKERRRSMIDDKIMNEFEAIEKMLMIQPEVKEKIDLDSFSEENVEETEEPSSKSEQSFNRVYEVKLREMEEDIKYRQEKIISVIHNRKSLMESIVMMKKKKLEENIALKEREMRDVIDGIKGKESNVVCSLSDLYSEIQHLKEYNLEPSFIHNFKEKSVYGLQAFYVSVKLENFIDIALEIKEAELQMMLQSKYKDIDRTVSVMRKEIEKLVVSSKEKLGGAIKLFRRSEKSKAMEYASTGDNLNQVDTYTINENEIFPDITAFEQFVESFKEFYAPPPKQICVYEDQTFRSEEILKNNPTSIPLFRRHFPFKNCVPNHVLKLLDVEITSLIKILSEMNLDKARVILHGLSFISEESAVHDVAINRIKKEILLDIVAALNDSTSMLVLGSFMDKKCDISLNLDKDCSLVYFEKTENVKKWSPTLENVEEVAIDIGLQHFGKTGCLDDISTKFDWAVATVPVGPSRFERFISDVGLLEQIKFAFLELHHHHLLCRSCNFTNHFKDSGLSIDHVSKLLSSKLATDSTGLLPLSSGTPTSDDVTVASYVSKTILMRGAILTAACLSNVIQRLEKNEITIITSSFFIQELHVYREILESYLSALNPGKQVHFIFCKKSSCGIGASIMASIASQISRKTPELYLLELQQRLKNKNKLFSVQSFLKLLSDPTLSEEAVQLSKNYMEEMKFDLPLAVVWAYNFTNDNTEEAEAIYKLYQISLSKVSHLVCRKICFSKDVELARTYIQFLKRFGVEQRVKESAYRTLLDLLFNKDMYQEAITLVQECKTEHIPLTKLRHSTLAVLHDFCARADNKESGISSFSLPIKDSDSSSSDSDIEEMSKLKA